MTEWSSQVPFVAVWSAAMLSCSSEGERHDRAQPETHVVIDISRSVDTFVAQSTIPIAAEHGLDDRQLIGGVVSGFLDGNRVVLANAAAPDVRIFAMSGQHARTVGRRGMGPGEFSAVSWVTPFPPDSFLAYDLLAGTVSVFSDTGEFGRSFALPPRGGSRRQLVWLDGGRGREIVAGLATVVPYFEMEIAGPQQRDTIDLVRVDRGGASFELLGTLPNRWWEKRYSPAAHRISAVRNAPHAVLARAGKRLYFSSNDDAALVVLDLDDGGQTILAFEGVAGRPYDEPHGLRGSVYFEQLVGTQNGHLWVGEAVPSEQVLRPWHVLDTHHRRIGVLALPANMTLLDATGESILGRLTDAAGAEQVVVMRYR